MTISFIKAAQDKKYGQPNVVSKLYHIGQEWKNNPDNPDDYAYICRGHFKTNWECEMEDDIMKQLNINYNDGHERHRKKCIARICMMKRTEIISNWNRLAQKTHGSTCKVTRSKEITNTTNKKIKFEKRKKDIYYFTAPKRIRLDGQTSSPSSSITHEEKIHEEREDQHKLENIKELVSKWDTENLI